MELSDYKYYRDLGWQHIEIAKELGVSKATLYSWLKTSYCDTYTKSCSSLLRFVESSLLGDGSIVPRGSKSCFCMSSSNEEYLDWLRKSLGDYEVKSGISHFLLRKEVSGYNKDCDIFNLKTRSSVFFNLLRDKWYPQGRKAVPKEFSFTKDDIIRIYNEDGTCSGKSCIIYWGEKDRDSFDRFVKTCKEFYQVMSVGEHRTGGLYVRIKYVETLPGYLYKSVW